MNKIQEQIISHVQMDIEPGEVVTEELLTELVRFYSCRHPLSESEFKEVVVDLQSKLAVRMDRGAYVKEKNHISWYYAAKSSINPQFWTRYSTYLYKDAGFNSDVINSIDAETDEMMDLLSDPTQQLAFQRRGLVIGDVQSGKTSTYLALMNKAADAGYHIIILLTGTIEKLRRQTQGRTDEGFVGLDSTAFNKNKDSVFVGVGNIDRSISRWAVTSTTSDFNTSTANKLSGKLSSINSPVVFVLKKNKSVLEKLEGWMRLFNRNPATGTIDSPLLLIDDEADNASVSTKPGEDPTTINKNIRKILKLFSKASYVGFTATPFANIFIDPDSSQEMLGDDLFPRDFIYALEAPTNYIGAASIFPKEGKYHFMINDNGDCERYVPVKHKKDHVPGEIPLSLRKAVAGFVIANAIRDLRGQITKHRSMMVNVSVYVDVQKRIADQLDSYVREMQREIRNYYMMKEVALQYSSFAFLKDVYDQYYSTCEFEWDTVQTALWSAIAPIVVRYVNGGNAAKNLNYDENEELGLRIIAVGGYSLSRGLTLEGLSTSYFYRNTKMYDTLMQMGRWFGYRPHYEDLCQVWINQDAVDWYSYISEASDELKREVRRMQAEQKTPADFGLCVRSDDATLLVTARNKMRTAKDYTMTVSLSGNIIETPFIHMNEKVQADNLHVTRQLLESIIADGIDPVCGDKQYALADKLQFLGVPQQYVRDFLGNYQSHTANSNFHTIELVKQITSSTDGSLDKWDIVVASGTGEKKLNVGGYSIPCVQRSFGIRPDVGAFQMSGSKSRLGNRSYAKGGLKKVQADKIEAGEHAEQIKRFGEIRPLNQNVFFKPDFFDETRRPLLVIYPVELKAPIEIKTNEDLQEQNAVVNTKNVLIGVSVGIPAIKGRESKQYQYKINLVKYREIMGLDETEPDEIDDTIED